ncbi:protease stability complex PrcB-like protein [Keratinibaculum paraultunense]|uniref:Protease stability complex PrcB-like protein n=1 Tax=Keratinibaculum paraultunense TaxID=1278232 RepID=A0A4R3KZE9_9FIRM|nr:S-layer homology domain-containing protein [Keratinibaculum paraultunense]QQY79965.1 S-layer homology domain-containing protein [Keratinibaculum paraultunense]TCS91714.1 protease stability complex PrcB-like protein [Keratinibaculum paraultunense]
MRKTLSIILIFVFILSTSNIVFADINDKLSNHWAKDKIRKDFVIKYFPYLANDDFKHFNPNGTIREDEFLLSFSSLLKDKGYKNSIVGEKINLNRAKMANIVGKKLIEESIIPVSNEKTTFKDINQLSKEEKESIAALYSKNLISGISNTKYAPFRNVTQAEAIIFLERVNDLLNDVSNISFKVLGRAESYSGKEGITVKTKNNKVLVTITKSFPTSGYDVTVNKVIKSGNDLIISLNISPPSKGSDQLQVITYKIITIEIDKKDIGNPPYNFIMGDIFMI